MERAPLRPVPGRPSGPVSEAAAVALLTRAVPALEERERVALALVALAATPRPAVAMRLGIDAAELSESLARARKELRRTLAPLPGSGWCERAERLVSDRLDGALVGSDEPRLDAHLRNCPRCVEHERRLVQATDALVASVAPAPSAPALVPSGTETAPAPPAPAPVPPGGAASASAPASAAVAARPAAREPAPLPARRPRRELASAVSWNVLLAIAVVLALASLALALAGALGAQL